MLTPDSLDAFARLDTDKMAAVIRESSVRGTLAGDAIARYMRHAHPERWGTVSEALGVTADDFR